MNNDKYNESVWLNTKYMYVFITIAYTIQVALANCLALVLNLETISLHTYLNKLSNP